MVKLKVADVDNSTFNPQVVGGSRQTFISEAAVDRDYSDGVLERVRLGMTRTEHRAKSLINIASPRVHFDPANVEHRTAYAVFIKTGRWTMRFYTELPSTNVPSTIDRKLIAHCLSDVTELADQEIAKFERPAVAA